MPLTVVEIPLAADTAQEYAVEFKTSTGTAQNITGYDAEITWRNILTPDTITATIGTAGGEIANGGATGAFTFVVGPFAEVGTYEGHFRWRVNAGDDWTASALFRVSVEVAR